MSKKIYQDLCLYLGYYPDKKEKTKPVGIFAAAWVLFHDLGIEAVAEALHMTRTAVIKRFNALKSSGVMLPEPVLHSLREPNGSRLRNVIVMNDMLAALLMAKHAALTGSCKTRPSSSPKQKPAQPPVLTRKRGRPRKTTAPAQEAAAPVQVEDTYLPSVKEEQILSDFSSDGFEEAINQLFRALD